MCVGVSGPQVFQSLALRSRWSVSFLKTWSQSFSAKPSLSTVLLWQLSYRISLRPLFLTLLALHGGGNKLNSRAIVFSRSVELLGFRTWFVACLLVLLELELHCHMRKHPVLSCLCWSYRFSLLRLDCSVLLLESLWQTKSHGQPALQAADTTNEI